MSVKHSVLRAFSLGAACAALAVPHAAYAATFDRPAVSHEGLDKLPPSTEITLPSNRKATLETLQAEHAARLARLANAASLASGLQFVIRGRTPFAGPAATPAPGVIVGRPIVKPTFAPTPLTQDFTKLGYAADYGAFCNAAKASVCLYVPGPGAYMVKNNTVEDVDVYMTQGQCSQYGGQWTPLTLLGMAFTSYCTLTYPASSSLHFDGGLPPETTRIASTCMNANDVFAQGYKGTVDPHGYFEAHYVTEGTPYTWYAINPSKTMTCVTQITPKG